MKLLTRIYVILVTVLSLSIYFTYLALNLPTDDLVKQHKSNVEYDIYKETPLLINRTFSYIIPNTNVCTCSYKHCIHLIIFICSRIDNFVARNVIRNTWLSTMLGNKGDIRYIFLIGRHRDGKYQKDVNTENERYGDILQEDFIESYWNLTLKTIMGLKWVSQECNNATFVLKIDDDVFLNTDNLLSAITLYGKNLNTSIGGYCISNGYPDRRQWSKFYLSYEDYPYDTYPPYCSGTAYVTSISVAKQLYAVSKKLKLFQFEDVFIGICLTKLGFGWTQIPGFAIDTRDYVYCKIKKSRSIITLHSVTPTKIEELWNSLCLHYQILLYVVLRM